MNILLVVKKLQLNKKFSISSLTVFLLHSLLAVVLKKPCFKTYSLICCICCAGVGCFYVSNIHTIQRRSETFQVTFVHRSSNRRVSCSRSGTAERFFNIRILQVGKKKKQSKLELKYLGKFCYSTIFIGMQFSCKHAMKYFFIHRYNWK